MESPTADAGRPRADGFATAASREGPPYCRCRTEADAPDNTVAEKLAAAIMGTVPSWLPVEGALPDKVYELEGRQARSFQTWTDFPLHQWHRWYDWNFHVEPDPPYLFLAGNGNTPDLSGDTDRGQRRRRGFQTLSERRVAMTTTVEGEWDCGAMTGTRLPFGHGQMGPMFNIDWAWPMTDDQVFLAGRWIYDCGHPDRNMNRTELHPCLAVAAARFEGFKFSENRFHTPAVQFMFYTNRIGGYYNFRSIKRDYEFIVELPRLVSGGVTASIGHTTEFPMNTIVLRASPFLKHFDFDRFIVGGAPVEPLLTPEVTPIPNPTDPSLPPEQARVRIPLTTVAGEPEAFGVLISMGWLDPDLSQARRVKKVTVTFQRARKAFIDHDDFAEEWMIKAGVNGRWFSNFEEGVSNGTDITLNKSFTFHLAEDDTVRISAHGAEIDLVEDVFVESERGRTLRFDNLLRDRTFALRDQAIDFARDLYTGDLNRQRHVASEVVERMLTTFNDQNDPLGIIDPGHRQRQRDSDNPLLIGDFIGEKPLTYTAVSTRELEGTAELVEDPNIIDFTLHATLKVEKQPGL